jgi:hypothetical protein
MLEEAKELCDELGIATLFERLSASIAPASEVERGGDAVFRREGEFWTVAFEEDVFRLRDVKGLRYIAALLASPGREVHVLELVGMANGSRADDRAMRAVAELQTSRPSDGAPLLDERAKEEYRLRLEQLDDELEEARGWGDTERAARLEEEVDTVTQELARAVGFRGRDRTFSSPAERARVSVTKAIRTAIKLIGNQSPALSEHLESSIQTGRFCSYATVGAPPPRWAL